MLYKDIKLGQTCELIPGFAFKSDDFGPAGIKVIKIKDIQPPFININDSDCVNIQKYDIEKLKKYLVKEGDFLLAMTGATIGKVGMYIDKTPSYINQRVLLFKPLQGYVKNFIYYCVNSSSFRDFVFNNVDSASAQPNISANTIAEFPIKNFDITIQNKIAITLSVLDKKILLNTHINSELEAMAKQLYDYWFVQFDFPDENGKPYKSSGGKMVYNEKLKREIPEGWEDCELKDITEIVNGATPLTSDSANYGEKIVWITPNDLSNQNRKFINCGERSITQKGYDSCSTTLMPEGSVLMSSRAPIGLLAIAEVELCTNQGFKSFVPYDMIDNYFIYYYIQEHMPQIEQLGAGTTFREVSRDTMSHFPILKIKDRRTYKKWYEEIDNICKMQKNVLNQIDNLTQLRNSLLPMLMNGQVIVE